ncbi:YadA-like family protein [Escherichia coli]
MNFKQSKVCLAVLLSLSPVIIPFASAQQDTNTKTIEVDEDSKGYGVYGNNWKSIEIGTTNFTAKDESKGINFDHKSPVAKGRNSIAIGTSAEAGGEIKDDKGFKTGESIAIGAKAKATKEQSIAIGGDTKATGWGAIVIGGDDLTPLHGSRFGDKEIPNNYSSSEASGDGSIVVGSRSTAAGELSVSLGSISSASGTAANALGATAEANGDMATAVGFNALANARNALAVGSQSSADGEDSLAIGSQSTTGKKSTVALGQEATASAAEGNVSIGAGSVDKAATPVSSATIKLKNGGTIEYKGFAGNNAASVVSVGDAGKERQIVNVGAGVVSEKSTDAINGSQLYAIAKTLKDDLDAINPTWKLKDSNGGSKEVGSKNGGTTGNDVTVTGKGDIAVTVNDKGMTIDGTKLTENIKTDAIKIKDNNGGLLKKNLSDEIEITGKGPIKTRVAGDKLEISAETASFTSDGNGGNGKITVSNGDDDKLVTAKKIADAINQSGWKIKADSENGGKVEGDNKEELINPDDTVTLKAGKNLSVKQRGGDFTFSVVDTPSFSSVQLNGKGNNGNVTLSSEGNKLILSGGNDAGQNGVVISGVASGLNGTAFADADGDVLNNAANIGDLKNALRDSSAALVNSGFGLQADDGSKVNTSLGKHITVGGDGQNISTTVQNGSLTVRLADNIRLADDGSVSVGGTRMDKNGLTIKDGPSVTVNGIDAAGRVISGVKDGVNDHDAVNVSQLNREISQATAATTWALKTESGDEAVAVSSQTVEVRHGHNTRVSAISKDDKGNYSYEIDVTGIPVEYTDSQGNPLVNIGGRFYTQTEDAATGKLTMTPAEPARVRISSEQPLVLTNVAAGNVSPVSTDAVNGSQLASAARISGGDNVVWKDGKATLAPDTFSELTTAGGGKTTVNGGVHKTPDNVADAVNMLNREGTKYFKAASSGQAAKAEGRDSIAVGQGAVSRGQNSIAMGNGAEVTRQAADGSVAIGSHARAGRANTGTYALNGQAVAGRTGSDTAVVSFGQPGQERQLQSVAPGVLSANSTDAVNGSQLHATNRQVAGNTQAINSLGNKFSQLSYRVEELNRDIRGVGASAAAMSGIPQAYLPGKSLMGLGVGGYGGESAIAIGVSRISDNGKVIMKLNAGQNTRGNFSVGAGVGWQW